MAKDELLLEEDAVGYGVGVVELQVSELEPVPHAYGGG